MPERGGEKKEGRGDLCLAKFPPKEIDVTDGPDAKRRRR